MINTLIIGGQTTNFKELYYYTNKMPNEIPQGSYWTEFKTESPIDAKSMTGSTNNLNYRVTVFVNNNHVYNFFSDAGTRYGPMGLGMALVYRNKKPINFTYLKIERIF